MLRTGVEQCPKTLGNSTVIAELRKACEERLVITDEFIKQSVSSGNGGEIMNKIK